MKKANLFQTNNKNLRPNPFNAYRDPNTGRWVVVKSDALEAKGDRKLISAAA